MTRGIANGGGALVRAAVSCAAGPLGRVLGALDAALNLATLGSVLLLTLAQPAFRETGPDWLRGLDLSVTFLDRSGAVIGQRGIRHEDGPRLDELPPHLVAAVLATEDRRFYRHWGIDPTGLARALVANVEADGVVQGGSTLTQQLAKNLFLTGERTFERKIKEAFLAVWLEARLSKDEILSLYLDRAYMGAGTFGIEAAARFYFGKSARAVSLPEAAMLAGLLKAPSRYAPHASSAAAEARAADVLDGMVEAGLLDRRDRDLAKRHPALAVARQALPCPAGDGTLRPHAGDLRPEGFTPSLRGGAADDATQGPAHGPGSLRSARNDGWPRVPRKGLPDEEVCESIFRPGSRQPGHYLDWAFREVQRLAAAGRLGRDTVLTVETPLDPALQHRAEAAVTEALLRDGERVGADEAAMVVMAPGGGVRAMVGGRDYGTSAFNRAVDARRQPGSAFKPLVYAAALAGTGLGPTSIVQDEEICIAGWCPANYGRSFAGPVTLAAALARSLNTVAVALSVEIGRAAGEMTVERQARFGRTRIIALAQSLGLRTALHDTPSLPLGASEVSVLDLAAVNAAFASGGLRAEPFAVTAVRTGDGRVVYRRDRDEPPPRRVLGPELVGDMNAMLRAVVERGTGRRAAIPGRAVAGKTGTTNGYRDAWFAGFTADLVGVVWFGNDDHGPTRGLTGGTLPAATWQAVMSAAHRDLPPAPLPGQDVALRIAGGRGGFAEVADGPGRGFAVVSGARGVFSVAR